MGQEQLQMRFIIAYCETIWKYWNLDYEAKNLVLGCEVMYLLVGYLATDFGKEGRNNERGDGDVVFVCLFVCV